MGKDIANIHQLKESVFAVIGDDGATNFGIIKGSDGSTVLIDADIRRMDEIDDALKRTGCNKVRYLLNTHENFDHSSANDYFEKTARSWSAPTVAGRPCRKMATRSSPRWPDALLSCGRGSPV